MTIPAPTNPAQVLDDGAVTYAPTGGGTHTRKGTVGGVARVYYAGSTTVPKAFVALFQASIVDRSSGNEQYVVTIEAAQNAGFTGEIRTLSEPWNITNAGQQDVVGVSTLDPLDNTIWPYLRFSEQLSGTTPILKVGAFVRSLSDLDPYTISQLVQLQVFTLQNLQNAIACQMGWATGVVGGGPNNDGRYPIYDGFGHSVLIKCPTQSEADGEDPVIIGDRIWLGHDETTGLSMADRETHSLITVGYNGKHPAKADDPFYAFNAEAVQAAFDRGGVVELPSRGKHFYLKSALAHRPNLTTVELNGSWLNFSDPTMFTDPATLPDMVGDTASIVPDTFDSNYNIWRVSGDNLILRPVGPNLVPEPRFDDVTQYLQTDDGPLNNTTFTKSSTNTSDGAYDTVFNDVTTRHKVQVVKASSTQSGTAQYGQVCLVDEATQSNLLAFDVEGGKRYAFGAKIRKMTGAATGIRVEAYFSKADGTGLGGGSSAGLPVNGSSASGHTFTIVDAPALAEKATIIISFDKTSASTSAAFIGFDNWFFRQIDPATTICPNYIDDVDNNGDYAAVGIALPDLVSFQTDDDGDYIPGSQIARYKVSFEVTSITPMGPQKYVIVTLRKGVGFGGAEPLAIRQTGLVEWETPAPGDIAAGAGGFVTFQSNNGVTIRRSSIVVKRLPENHGILIQSHPEDPGFDHAGHTIRNGFLQGPNLAYTAGLVYDTPADNRSSQGAIYNLQVFGFGCAREFRTQAYLINDFNCTFFGIDCAERGVPSRNAGEQINSFGSRFSGGRVGHDNCFERRIFGGSTDYISQHRFAITSNTFETWGHHYEAGRPEHPDEIPFWANEGGSFRLWGGKVEYSGVGQDQPAEMPWMFYLNHKFAVVDLNGVEASYWRTSSGFLVGGEENEGRAFVRNMRGGDTKNLTCFVKDDSRHNKFGAAGDCETDEIELNMWVSGGVRTSAYETANIVAEMATDSLGRGCLQLTKSGGKGTAAVAYIWFEAPPASLPGFRMNFCCPVDNLGTGSEPIPDRQLYFTTFSTYFLPPTTANDQFPGVYRLPSSLDEGFFGLYNHTLDTVDGMTEYVTIESSGSRADDTIFFDGWTRESDNRIVQIINMTDMPDGTVLQCREFKGAAI